jgi:hypothetical protein
VSLLHQAPFNVLHSASVSLILRRTSAILFLITCGCTPFRDRTRFCFYDEHEFVSTLPALVSLPEYLSLFRRVIIRFVASQLRLRNVAFQSQQLSAYPRRVSSPSLFSLLQTWRHSKRLNMTTPRPRATNMLPYLSSVECGMKNTRIHLRFPVSDERRRLREQDVSTLYYNGSD